MPEPQDIATFIADYLTRAQDTRPMYRKRLRKRPLRCGPPSTSTVPTASNGLETSARLTGAVPNPGYEPTAS